MAKRKKLNGLPGNLAQSYLSTLGYYDGGYMADWINYIAREKHISEINIDILSKQIFPKEAEIKPLLADLDKLKDILERELINNGFQSSFIKQAVIRFEIPIKSPAIHWTIYCYPQVVDENGNIYKPKKRIIETASQIDLNSVKKLETNEAKETLIEKIKKILN